MKKRQRNTTNKKSKKTSATMLAVLLTGYHIYKLTLGYSSKVNFTDFTKTIFFVLHLYLIKP